MKINCKLFLLLPIFYFWFTHASVGLKLRSLIGACSFALIESGYSLYHHGIFKTTFVQFLMNIWSHFIISDFYFSHIPDHAAIRVVLFPLIVWFLEIVQHFFIKFIFGKNVAWDYSKSPTGRLDSAIDVSMYWEWWALGAVMQLVYVPLIYSRLP